MLLYCSLFCCSTCAWKCKFNSAWFLLAARILSKFASNVEYNQHNWKHYKHLVLSSLASQFGQLHRKFYFLPTQTNLLQQLHAYNTEHYSISDWQSFNFHNKHHSKLWVALDTLVTWWFPEAISIVTSWFGRKFKCLLLQKAHTTKCFLALG